MRLKVITNYNLLKENENYIIHLHLRGILNFHITYVNNGIWKIDFVQCSFCVFLNCVLKHSEMTLQIPTNEMNLFYYKQKYNITTQKRIHKLYNFRAAAFLP